MTLKQLLERLVKVEKDVAVLVHDRKRLEETLRHILEMKADENERK